MPRVDREAPNTVAIFHDENNFLRIAAFEFDRRRRLQVAFFRSAGKPWQIDFRGRTLTGLRINIHVAAGLLHEAINLGKTKAGAFAGGLRRKKWVDAGGRDSLQPVDVVDALDFKIQIDDRVRAIFFRFADQRPQGRLAICFPAGALTARQPDDALTRPIE